MPSWLDHRPRQSSSAAGDWVGRSGLWPTHQWQTRSSDLLYTHFRSFEMPRGCRLVAVIQTAERLTTQLQKSCAAETGLLPDFVLAQARSDCQRLPSLTFSKGERWQLRLQRCVFRGASGLMHYFQKRCHACAVTTSFDVDRKSDRGIRRRFAQVTRSKASL